jgi:Protein of unknown function (DUF726).
LSEEELDLLDSAIFDLVWESKDDKDFYWGVGKVISLLATRGILALALAETPLGLAALASSSVMDHYPISSLFKKAKDNAKTAGKLLACALALRLPLKTQTISLVGYSLGSQVIKSCLKTLDVIYEGQPCDIIQDVTFLAGAAHFDKNKEKYKRLFATIVNGETKNVFSTGDSVLLCYMVSEAVWHPLGRNRIKICQEKDEDLEQRKKTSIRYGKDLIYSFDATSSIVTKAVNGSLGHQDYMDERIQAEIMDKIEWS